LKESPALHSVCSPPRFYFCTLTSYFCTLTSYFCTLTSYFCTLLLLDSALVSTWDAHVLTILRNRSASDLDTLRLKDARDLFVG